MSLTSFASPALSQSSKAKGRRRKGRGPRPSDVDLKPDAPEASPATPINRFAARQHADSFSPFSFRSKQDPPRLALPSSPSVILFSGPAQRGFERVHDDTFPQELDSLRDMARTKFRFAPSAPVEMSYVNPDGVLCDLDDEHDLRALAAHAASTPKLKINVTTTGASPLPNSSQLSAVKQPANPSQVAQSPSMIVRRPAPNDAPETPRRAKQPKVNGDRTETASSHPSSAPTSARPNGNRKGEKETFKSSDNVVHSSDAATPQFAVVPNNANGPTGSKDCQPASVSLAQLNPDLGLQPTTAASSPPVQSQLDPEPQTGTIKITASASQPVPPSAEANGATKPSNKRKRAASPAQAEAPASDAVSSPAPSSPTAPIAKRPRGRPKKMLDPNAAPNATQPTQTAAVPNAEIPTKIADQLAPTPAPTPAEVAASKADESPLAPVTLPKRATRAAASKTPSARTPFVEAFFRQDDLIAPSTDTANVEPASETLVQPAAAEKPNVSAPAMQATSTTAEAASAKTIAKATATGRPRGRPPKKAPEPVPEAVEKPASQPEVDPSQGSSAAVPASKPVRKTRAIKASKEDATNIEIAAPPAQPDSTAAAPAASEATTTVADSTKSSQATADTAAPSSSDPSAVGDKPAKITAAEKRAEAAKKKRASKAAEAATAAPSAEADALKSSQMTVDTIGDASAPSSSAPVPEADGANGANGEPVELTAAEKRAAAAKKKRASKAAETKAAKAAKQSEEAAAEAAGPASCVVCGASPYHDKEGCPVWLGGSQAILDLLAMIRNKGNKTKKEKESSHVLYRWLAEQFGVSQSDAEPSQATTQPSQAASVAQPAAETGVSGSDASQAAATAATPPQDEAQGEDAGKKAAPARATAQKRKAAVKASTTEVTAETELPPPSGIEGPAPANESATRATAPRGRKKNVVAAAEIEPRIALTPSSPAIPTPSQSQETFPGLRAPSESSEAELATSPLLSAAPREADDMDVDPLPSQTAAASNSKSSAEQQLEERKRRMKQGERAARKASAKSQRDRSSASASDTSSDSSDGGDSSDSGGDSDGETGAGSRSHGDISVRSKSGPRKSGSRHRGAAAASSSSDSDSASSGSGSSSNSDSETESEPEAAPASPAKPASRQGGGRGTQRTNPFMRGLTPISTSQPNGSAPSTARKTTPHMRLSDLNPTALRQNSSQPGSPMSTGNSTPLSAPAAPAVETIDEIQNDSGSEYDSDSSDSSSSSSDDEAPGRKRGSARFKTASTQSKRAGTKGGAPAAAVAAPAKKRRGVFSYFSQS